MKRQPTHFLLLTAFIALAACGTQPNHLNTTHIDTDTLLLKVGMIADQYPDSALELLSSIEKPHQLNDKQSALFLLRLVQTKDKLGQDVGSDTLIFKAKDYFKRENNPKNLALSMFYCGRVLHAQNKIRKALRLYFDARTLAEKIDDYQLTGLADYHIGKLDNNLYQYVKSGILNVPLDVMLPPGQDITANNPEAPLVKIKSDKYSQLQTNSMIAKSIIVFRADDTLSISCDGGLVKHLIGYDISPKGLQSALRVKLKMEKKNYTDKSDTIVTRKITYKNSIIVIYNNPETGYDIAYANIVDKEIILLDGIHIGMTKKECLDKVFCNQYNYDYSEINVFENGDIFGDRSQFFIFRNNQLAQIILESSYNWAYKCRNEASTY